MSHLTVDVTAAVIIHKGKVLCARRAAHKDLSGFWEFPGGKIEPGESFVECLQRELKEELGIKTRVDKYLLSTEYQYTDKRIRLFVYKVSWLSGHIRCVDHDEIRWLPISELSDLNWAPADLPVIDFLKELNTTNN